MFHFPAFPPHCLCVQQWVTAHDDCRVSPFGHPRIKAQLAAPRGLSRPLTSFIGSWCQGIHRAPLKTWPTDARVHCVVLKQRPATHHPHPKMKFTGAGIAEGQPFGRTLRYPTTCQARSPPLSLFSTPKQYLQDVLETVPTNQRSTHELTVQNICLQSVLCSLERR